MYLSIKGNALRTFRLSVAQVSLIECSTLAKKRIGGKEKRESERENETGRDRYRERESERE